MLHQWLVQVCLLRDGELEHHLLFRRQFREPLQTLGEQRFFAAVLVGRIYVHLGLKHGHEAFGDDFQGDLELLGDDRFDSLFVVLLDDGALLGAENAGFHRFVEQLVELRHVLHQLNAVLFFCQTLVDLQERHDPFLFPKVLGRGDRCDFAVHRGLEQDGADDAAAMVRRVHDDTCAHLVHLVHHFLLSRVFALLDAVQFQRLWCAPTTLV
mmetsp:Transcript_11086/g.29364  ORF Transcript_11086/g.29364 Transcript_11086/m.29364 type:complete len:211 (-) Transcript_11086:1531-2163(-)